MIAVEQKADILATMVRDAMAALADRLPQGGGAVSGDDVLDLFAMGIAAIIENDSHLQTPIDYRQALDMAARRTDGLLRVFQDMRQQTGMSALSFLMIKAGNA